MGTFQHLRKELTLGDGRKVVIAPATEFDAQRIRWLYHCVYGGNYSFPIVYNADRCVEAIHSDRYLWLLARSGNEAVASVIFTVDREIRLGKVFGGVVSDDFRKHGLMRVAISMGLKALLEDERAVRSVYATTRTVSLDPQRLVEKLGFKRLGIFPNAHKVNTSETHTLAVHFAQGALEARKERPRLPAILRPFFAIVCRETGIPEAEYADLPMPVDAPDGPPVRFETIEAQEFILRRFAERRSENRLVLDFFPFQEPNLLLVSSDGKTEIYSYRSAKDGHCVLTGAYSENLEPGTLLDYGARFLEDMGTRYLEVLIEAGDAEQIQEALGAGFIPSAYYPAMRWDPETGAPKDYVVLSRSLAILDFKGVVLQPAYADYLREYLTLWSRLHIDKVFPRSAS